MYRNFCEWAILKVINVLSFRFCRLPPTSPINRISHVEESHNEQEADMAQHSLPVDDETKLFHQKHKHKKSGRYQGPFSDHNRKRKYSLLGAKNLKFLVINLKKDLCV